MRRSVLGQEKGQTPDRGDQDSLFCVTGAMLHRLCQSRCSGPPSGRAENLRCKQERETLRRAVMGKSSLHRTAPRHPRPAAPCRPPLNYPAPRSCLCSGKDIRCDGARVLLCWLRHQSLWVSFAAKLGALRSPPMITDSGTALPPVVSNGRVC